MLNVTSTLGSGISLFIVSLSYLSDRHENKKKKVFGMLIWTFASNKNTCKTSQLEHAMGKISQILFALILFKFSFCFLYMLPSLLPLYTDTGLETLSFWTVSHTLHSSIWCIILLLRSSNNYCTYIIRRVQDAIQFLPVNKTW